MYQMQSVVRLFHYHQKYHQSHFKTLYYLLRSNYFYFLPFKNILIVIFLFMNFLLSNFISSCCFLFCSFCLILSNFIQLVFLFLQVIFFLHKTTTTFIHNLPLIYFNIPSPFHNFSSPFLRFLLTIIQHLYHSTLLALFFLYHQIFF